MSFFDERYAQEVRRAQPKPEPEPVPPPARGGPVSIVGDVVNLLFTVGTKAADFFTRRLYR